MEAQDKEVWISPVVSDLQRALETQRLLYPFLDPWISLQRLQRQLRLFVLHPVGKHSLSSAFWETLEAAAAAADFASGFPGTPMPQVN